MSVKNNRSTMAKAEAAETILGLLSQNEAKVAELYALYAELFYTQEKFWQRLVEEEKGHAALLHSLDERFGSKPGCFKASPYGPAIIKYVSDFIDQSIATARRSHLDQSKALATALSLEQSMVEKKYFEVFTPQQVDIEMVFEKLNHETQEHARQLEKRILAVGLI